MANTKFCVDCKFFKEASLHSNTQLKIKYGRCQRPRGIDPVSGHVLPADTHCSTERKFPHLCGPTGKYWWPARVREGAVVLLEEEQDSLWAKILGWFSGK